MAFQMQYLNLSENEDLVRGLKADVSKGNIGVCLKANEIFFLNERKESLRAL